MKIPLENYKTFKWSKNAKYVQSCKSKKYNLKQDSCCPSDWQRFKGLITHSIGSLTCLFTPCILCTHLFPQQGLRNPQGSLLLITECTNPTSLPCTAFQSHSHYKTYPILPCVMCTHIFVQTTRGVIIPMVMSSLHPCIMCYFSLKILGKKMPIIHNKIWYLLQTQIVNSMFS